MGLENPNFTRISSHIEPHRVDYSATRHASSGAVREECMEMSEEAPALLALCPVRYLHDCAVLEILSIHVAKVISRNRSVWILR